MLIKIYKMFRKHIQNIKFKYHSGKLKTIKLDNFLCFKNYMQNKIIEYRNLSANDYLVKIDENINCLLAVNRVTQFKKLFGLQDFICRNDVDNYKFFIWSVEHNGCQALIFTANGYGTTVKIIVDEDNNPTGSVDDFFDAYLELMKNFN